MIENNKLYHYIVVRTDLPVGFLSAQVAHASGESLSEPVAPGTFAVVLGVDTEAELRALHTQLKAGRIRCILVEETDAPYTGQATAIGIEPTTDKATLKKYLSRLSLYGKGLTQ